MVVFGLQEITSYLCSIVTLDLSRTMDELKSAEA